MLRLTIVYDNKASKDFTESWGFAAFIETNRKSLLFDTGWDGLLLMENMKNLPKSLRESGVPESLETK